ncbi:FG-GAP-like repeat-containing protein [Streptosporangium sp. NPDC051022]|uniref:FG-GAP-like repeat-containing protein n=1 Tax=Streptosporangium sp. NPDC051022 TaxID=3155752 RepID=UPI00344920C4
MLVVAPSIVAGTPVAPPALAAFTAMAPTFRIVDSYNMRGQSQTEPGSRVPESRWQTALQRMVDSGSEALALQEAGSAPPERAEWTHRTFPSGAGVTEHRYAVGSESRPQYHYIYWADTGQQRNGLAIAVRGEVHVSDAVMLPVHSDWNSRPMMGVLIGDYWYFTAHAHANGRDNPNDAEDIITTAQRFMANRPPNEEMGIFGDLNQRPENLRAQFQNHIVASDQPTHEGGGTLDMAYLANDTTANAVGERQFVNSDHYAVRYFIRTDCGLPGAPQLARATARTALAAAAEPSAECNGSLVPGVMYRMFLEGVRDGVLANTGGEPTIVQGTGSPREGIMPLYSSRPHWFLLSSPTADKCLERASDDIDAAVSLAGCDPRNERQQWNRAGRRVFAVNFTRELRAEADFIGSRVRIKADSSNTNGWRFELWPALRPMALGSSTTYGQGSSDGNGYRDSADAGFGELTRRSAASSGLAVTGKGKAKVMSDDDATPRVDWVGSIRVGTMSDRETEGWKGYRIHEIAGKAQCAVDLFQPNLITLIAGGNDVIQNYEMGGAIGRLEALVEQVSADSHGVAVLVAGVQPFRDGAVDARGEAFTAQVPAMVDRLVERGLHVVYTDISGLDQSDIGPDGIHPNDQGYDKIGAAFVKAAGQARDRGWIWEPNPQAEDKASDACGIQDDGPGDSPGEEEVSKLGRYWEDRGVIQAQQFPSDSRFWMVDINKDRKAEFVVVDKDQNFRFWWNSGPSGKNWMPFVEGQNSYQPGAGAVGNMLRFGDVDGDGFPDCMVVHLNGVINLYTWKAENPSGARMCTNRYNGVASVFANGSDNGDKPPLNIDPNTKIRIADVTGGGRDDYLLIEPDGTTTAWYNKGFQVKRTFQYLEWEVPQKISGALQLPREIRYADINGDKRADRILITAKGGARAWINEGATGAGGTYRDIGRIAGDGDLPPKDIQFADLDGDGKADFLRIGWTGVAHAWLNKLPPDYFNTFHP